MVDLKPNLASYARVSYFRELHGDLDGAVAAMDRAIAAGGPARENVAYVQSLLGDLELARGRRAAAPARYGRRSPRCRTTRPPPPGVARLAAAAGRPAPARSPAGAASSTRLPLPEYVIALGEAELAAGRRAAARRDLELVRAQQALLAGAGVNTDVELALFEADHGDRPRGATLARAAWAARAQRALRRRARLGADPRRAGRGRACAGRTARLRSARSTPGCAITQA